MILYKLTYNYTYTKNMMVFDFFHLVTKCENMQVNPIWFTEIIKKNWIEDIILIMHNNTQ